MIICPDVHEAWMADWCPAPEDRNVIVGVAVTFVYAIDSFANGESLLLIPTLDGNMLNRIGNSPYLSSVRSAELPRGI